ncbi:MAG: Bax inhibitor-1/YccA family protein [Proteobacteria bacterium]|nr:Bax inhibitor-1/YccA family protein [Pseudomonadota bacterium]
MAEPKVQLGSLRAAGRARTDVDEGLRAYMLKVYNYMGLGLALSGAVAFYVSTSEALLQAIFGSGLSIVVMLAPLAFILVLSFGINRLSAQTAQVLYWAFAATMGLSLSTVFLAYTPTSIVRVFFISAATFGAMSLYGYTTTRSLMSWGSFLFMGLIGVFIAFIVNIFLASAALDFAISVIGVLVFVGLTAYDTQRIRNEYSAADGAEIATKKAVFGALSLYLDFINLMMMLLRLFGERR